MSPAFATSRSLLGSRVARSHAAARRGLVLLLLVAVALLVLPTTVFALPPSGHITGTVRNPGGTGIEGVYVEVYAAVAGDWDYIDEVFTNSSGFYDVSGLATGTYRLEFWDMSGSYLGEYYNDAATFDAAASIAVTAGSTTSGKDATLAPAGHITGRVTNPGGTGIADAFISARVFQDGEWHYGWGAQTDSNGNYDVGGLPTSTCRLYFEDYSGAYLSEFYDNAATFDDAADVGVTAGSTTSGKDAELATGGRVTGRVTNPGGAGIEGVLVSVCALEDGEWLGFWESQTDSNGDYSVSGMPTGTYRLRFEDESGTYLGECYNNAATMAAGANVGVTAGDTTYDKNATLALAGHVTGKITNPVGAGIAGAMVIGYRLVGGDWEIEGGSDADPSGNYDLGGLPTGTYRLEFWDNTGSYLGEYYDDAADLEAATNVAVTAGQTTSGKNAQLADPGHITGTVTNPGGTGIEDAVVFAYRLVGGAWEDVNGAWTDASGFYDIGGLPTGTYRLEFWDTSGLYLGECYNNAADIDSAADVSVTAGSTTANKDAQLAAAGHITGRVTDSGDAALENISIAVYSLNDGAWEYFGDSYTDALGDYDVGSLPTGAYRIRFRDDEGVFAGEYYDDVATLAAASNVAVTAGATTSGKNASLAAAGHITGTVTDNAGAGIGDVSVSVYEVGGSNAESWAEVYTDSHGNYDVSGLATGSYIVRFDDFDTETYVGEYYNGAIDVDSATPVSVTAGSTTPHIDATLASTVVSRNVYRFRNLRNGFYLWSSDENEKATIIATLSDTWKFEGVAYKINAASPKNESPLWRFLNLRGGFYLYSSDPSERDNIINTLSDEWRLEGPAYSVSRDPSGRPVWRFRNKHDGTYLLSSDPAEKDTIVATLQDTWQLEGPAFYIAP